MPRSCADQDVPLTVAMDAVARFQHRAAFRQSGVVADLLLFHAGLTRLFLAYADHFAPKLVAFHEAERVATPRFQAGLLCLSLKNVEWINTISLRLVECFSLIPGLD